MEEVLRLNCPLLGGERQLLPSSKLKKNTHIYLPSVYFTPRVETFSTVARKLGVDRQQLLALNSEAYSTVKRPVRGETKLKTGSKVLIPFDLSPKPVVQADDVAEMVLFLASNASRGCTGQEFKVDGGNI